MIKHSKNLGDIIQQVTMYLGSRWRVWFPWLDAITINDEGDFISLHTAVYLEGAAPIFAPVNLDTSNLTTLFHFSYLCIYFPAFFFFESHRDLPDSTILWGSAVPAFVHCRPRCTLPETTCSGAQCWYSEAPFLNALGILCDLKLDSIRLYRGRYWGRIQPYYGHWGMRFSASGK